ncbi:hypothetical protein KM043_002095 [Ampulex compressa]|nr:hypothetical protein KM043_002095 [Ampulex compressa]
MAGQCAVLGETPGRNKAQEVDFEKGPPAGFSTGDMRAHMAPKNGRVFWPREESTAPDTLFIDNNAAADRPRQVAKVRFLGTELRTPASFLSRGFREQSGRMLRRLLCRSGPTDFFD